MEKEGKKPTRRRKLKGKEDEIANGVCGVCMCVVYVKSPRQSNKFPKRAMLRRGL